ncbi:MAG: HlyD family efflux transporter periplasmic adaptor subunit [Gammaproteobacteria bacterium]|jgi:RND family efflux transporter MFP subunit|nr:HlyD family efflux transporter periplasmic adaptor subunit [Gammaproteobacteria bacterium]
MPTREEHIKFLQTLADQRIPRVMPAVAWILTVFLLAGGAFLAFVPWVQTTMGFGTVTALNPNDRLQEINALVSGRIEEWYVRDGSRVVVGDPIVRIVDNDPRLLERLKAERDQAVAKLEALDNAIDTAEIDVNRMRDLFDQGLAARREFEQARIKVQELRSRMAEAAAELTRADINLSRQSAQIVRAPRNGVILKVSASEATAFVSPGDVVASFVPDNAIRAVELYISGRDVALVRPGDKVRLQFDGWPVVQFSGWPSVAVGTFGGEVLVVDRSANSTGSFRVIVIEDESAEKPWPDQTYVRFGSKARGWVLLNTVPVGYELWRRLNSFPPNLPGIPDQTETG